MLRYSVLAVLIVVGIQLVLSASVFSSVALVRAFGGLLDSVLARVVDIILFFPFGAELFFLLFSIFLFYQTIITIKFIMLFISFLNK